MRCKTPVQSQLFLATGSAFLQSRVIQKTKIDRLLDLVDPGTRQDDPRGMRFNHPEFSYRMLIDSRILQPPDQGLLCDYLAAVWSPAFHLFCLPALSIELQRYR